jgi:Flp pilus assembly protein CpaB
MVILIVAVVVGAIASFGLLNYIRNVEGSVYDNAEPETVWVVQQGIAKGTPAEQALAQGLLTRSEIPASFRPATAVVDPETELAGLVAITDLPANATVVAGNFVAPSIVNTGITDRLEEKGLTTVTFSVDQVKGAAYLIEPGDFVNILSLAPAAAAQTDQPSESKSATAYNFVSRYVYQKVEVLAIDKALTPDLGESADKTETPRNGGMITLAVPPEAVPLILSVGTENLYLSLVPADYQPTPQPAPDLSRPLFPGEDPNLLTPYGPAGETKAQ